jgi:hypothetical protein
LLYSSSFSFLFISSSSFLLPLPLLLLPLLLLPPFFLFSSFFFSYYFFIFSPLLFFFLFFSSSGRTAQYRALASCSQVSRHVMLYRQRLSDPHATPPPPFPNLWGRGGAMHPYL